MEKIGFGYIDDILVNKENYNIEEVAKFLNIKGFGRNKLLEWLRNSDFFDQYNKPLKAHIKAGLFVINDNYYKTPLVTVKGIDFLKVKLK
jgi:phage antirepressor YoqD-like protein